MTRGAGGRSAPLTYEGVYDPDLRYLPRHVVTVAGTAYMATSRHDPADPPPGDGWLPLGGAAVPTYETQQRTYGRRVVEAHSFTRTPSAVPLDEVNSTPIDTGRDGDGTSVYDSGWAYWEAGYPQIEITADGLYYIESIGSIANIDPEGSYPDDDGAVVFLTIDEPSSEESPQIPVHNLDSFRINTVRFLPEGSSVMTRVRAMQTGMTGDLFGLRMTLHKLA